MDDVKNASFETVEKKLKSGKIDTKYSDYDGRTALHIAAAEANDDICKLLIEHGADPEAEDRWEDTPLDCTEEGSSTEKIVSTENIERRLGPVRVILYAKKGYVEGVSTVLDKYGKEAAIYYDWDKRTALHIASSEGTPRHKRIVELLLLVGANPKAEDRWGKTPLDNATAKGFSDIMRLLGSDPDTNTTTIHEF